MGTIHGQSIGGRIRLAMIVCASVVVAGIGNALPAQTTASRYRPKHERQAMPTDHFAAFQASQRIDDKQRAIKQSNSQRSNLVDSQVQQATFVQPQLMMPTERDLSDQPVPNSRYRPYRAFDDLPQYKSFQVPPKFRYAKTSRPARKMPRYVRAQEDPFGEGQVMPDEDDVPSVFETRPTEPRSTPVPNRGPQNRFPSGSNGSKDRRILPDPRPAIRQSPDVLPEIVQPDSRDSNDTNDGFILPPRNGRDRQTPRIPGGEVMPPDSTPDQRLPKMSEFDLSTPATDGLELDELSKSPLEGLQKLPPKSESDGSESGDLPSDSGLGQQPIPVPGGGPDSWYRGNPNQTRPQGPYGYNQGVTAPPYGNWNTQQNPAAYGQPNYFNSPSAPGASVYHPALVNAANGGCGPMACGTNTCGTGIVNGCYDNVFYLSVFGGYSDLDALVMDDEAGRSVFNVHDGYVVGGSIGQFQGRNLRTEIEFAFRENDFTNFSVENNPSFDAVPVGEGSIRAYSGMANAIWEFVQFPHQQFKPYVGAGFGFLSAEYRATVRGENIIDPETDSDSSFAFQWMAGMTYRANSSVDWFAEYRMLKADSLQLETTGVNTSLPNGSGGFNYESGTVLSGLRFKF